MTTRIFLILSLTSLLAACGDKDDDTGSTGAVTGDATSGEALFSSCAGCHGADGTGGIDIGGTPSADLTARVPALSDADLEDVIMNGFNTAMPAQYTDAQDVADVVAYLRATFL